MESYLIYELDRDYNTVTDEFTKQFSSREEAEKWCKEESWSGYSYYIRF